MVWVITDERKTFRKQKKCYAPLELHKGMSKMIATVKK